MLCGSIFSSDAGAAGLQIAPLKYEAALEKAEVKKGFVDISNPSSQTQKIAIEVQAFRQIDDSGALEFFDDEQIKSGVKLDYERLTLESRASYRVYFLLDGTKLPSGDVFAAIFAREVTEEEAVASQAVRVGTLLLLENGTPGARQAEVTQLGTAFLHFGDAVTGEYRIKNTAPADTASGFQPDVTVRIWPFGGEHENRSSLIFAGRERSNEFRIETSSFGLQRLTVSYGDSQQTRWVFIVNLWLVLVIIVLIVVIFLIFWYRRRSGSLSFRSSKRK